jgi:phage protein D
LLSNPGASVREPRLRVLAGGDILTGAFQAEVISTNRYGADRFSVGVALGPDPWADAAFWSSAENLHVEVQFSVDQGQTFISMIQGFADLVSLDAIGGSVRLRGRDLSAALIEARTQEAFANRTASEIAAIFAQRHGLTPAVVATSTLVGRYYGGSYATATLDQFTKSTTEWDLLAYLARCEQYDIFVQGTVLYFQPIADADVATLRIRPEDVSKITLNRALSLVGDVEVTVKSWNSQLQQTVIECVQGSMESSGAAAQSSESSSPSKYVLVRPNLTPDIASRLAKQQIAELCRHERTVHIVMPGELTMMPGSVILLDGTETAFDQAYYIDTVERVMQPRTGFTQSVILKNTSPRSYTSSSSASTP